MAPRRIGELNKIRLSPAAWKARIKLQALLKSFKKEPPDNIFKVLPKRFTAWRKRLDAAALRGSPLGCEGQDRAASPPFISAP